MRLLLAAAATLVLAACGQTPAPVTPAAPPSRAPEPVQRGDLIGLSVDELGARFGQPVFQVREGPGLKLQWSSPACVLDAFLYAAPGTPVMRVTYVDARRPTGDPTPQAPCVAALDAAR